MAAQQPHLIAVHAPARPHPAASPELGSPGERSLPPSGVRLLGAVGVILSGLMVARGLYRSDVDVLLALPALGLLGYVLARSLRDRRTREVTARKTSAR